LTHAPPGFLIAMSAIVGVPPSIARRMRSWSGCWPVHVSVSSVVVHDAVRPSVALYSASLHVNGSADANEAANASTTVATAAFIDASRELPLTRSAKASAERSAPRGRRRRARQPDRLHERAVGRDVPRRKPDPFLPRGVERNLETLLPERRQIGGRDDLPVGLVAIAPDDFDEVERKRPLDLGGDRPLVAGAFDGVARDQHFTGGDEVVAALHRVDDRAGVVDRRQAIELHVVHRTVGTHRVVRRPAAL